MSFLFFFFFILERKFWILIGLGSLALKNILYYYYLLLDIVSIKSFVKAIGCENLNDLYRFIFDKIKIWIMYNLFKFLIFNSLYTSYYIYV